MQTGVFGLINNTHPASTNFLYDAVVGDDPPDKRVGARHSVVILGCDRRLVNEPAGTWLILTGEAGQVPINAAFTRTWR